MERIDEILKFEKAKSNENNSSEFHYKNKADDSERLISFGEDIFKCFEMYIDESNKLINDLATFVIVAKKDRSEYTIKKFEDTVISQIQSKYTFTDITELKYKLYFNDYSSTFQESYNNWNKEIQVFDEGMIKAREDCKQIVINKEPKKGLDDIISIRKKHIEDTNKTELHRKLRIELLEGLSNLSSIIRSST